MRRALRALLRFTWLGARLAAFLLGAVAVAVLALVLTVRHHFEASDVTVPEVVGSTLFEAEERLARADLGMAVEARRPHEEVEAGLVFFQQPRAGTTTRRKRQVRVVLSTGPASTRVPDVRGESTRKALLTLGRVGLASGEVLQVHSAEADANEVIAQEPPAGARVSEDGRVDLVVSLGPRSRALVMPDLRGHSVRDADLALGSAGLRLSEVTERIVSGVAGGTIHEQLPPPGTRVTTDTPIRLVVAKNLEPTVHGGRSSRFRTESP